MRNTGGNGGRHRRDGLVFHKPAFRKKRSGWPMADKKTERENKAIDNKVE